MWPHTHGGTSGSEPAYRRHYPETSGSHFTIRYTRIQRLQRVFEHYSWYMLIERLCEHKWELTSYCHLQTSWLSGKHRNVSEVWSQFWEKLMQIPFWYLLYGIHACGYTITLLYSCTDMFNNSRIVCKARILINKRYFRNRHCVIVCGLICSISCCQWKPHTRMYATGFVGNLASF